MAAAKAVSGLAARGAARARLKKKGCWGWHAAAFSAVTREQQRTGAVMEVKATAAAEAAEARAVKERTTDTPSCLTWRLRDKR